MNLSKKKIIVLISGRGSNLAALIKSCAMPEFPAQIVMVISDQADAKGLELAKEAGIPTLVLEKKDYPSKKALDQELDFTLRQFEPDYILLAGYMRILSAEFVLAWQNKLVNIHPSLLPEFKGLDTHKRALDAKVAYHGCSVHFVRLEMDTGPLILQAKVKVRQDDTETSLSQRILEKEHIIYSHALRLLCEGWVRVEGEQAFIRLSPHQEQQAPIFI